MSESRGEMRYEYLLVQGMSTLNRRGQQIYLDRNASKSKTV